jgi:hypothetical protein
MEEVKRDKSQPSESEGQEPKTNEQLVAAYESALTEISGLDPYDPNYHKMAAQAWAKTGLDKLLLQSVLNEIDKRLEETPPRSVGASCPAPRRLPTHHQPPQHHRLMINGG